MTIEIALVELLKASIDVTDLIASRIFPMVAPEHVAAPFVTYQRISCVRDETFDGPNGSSQSRIQVDAYASDYAGSKVLSVAIRKALFGFRGMVSGHRINYISLQNDQDFLDNTVEPKVHRVSMDFMITHDE